MENYSNRINTFANWNGPVSKYELALNGFYMLCDLHVRCHFCRIEFTQWTEDDDVVETHRRWAPQCLLFKKVMPLDSIEYVFLKYNTRKERVASFEGVNIHNISAESFAEAGFFYTGVSDKVTCFMCNVTIHEFKKTNVPLNEHFIHAMYCPFLNKFYTHRISTVSSLSTTTENDEVKQNCIICYSAEADSCYFPCGHAVSCYSCALKTRNCIMCRSNYSKIVKLYFN